MCWQYDYDISLGKFKYFQRFECAGNVIVRNTRIYLKFWMCRQHDFDIRLGKLKYFERFECVGNVIVTKPKAQIVYSI